MSLSAPQSNRPPESSRLARLASWPVLVWLALVLAGALILVTRLQFSYDLALFLPPAKTPDQQVLLDRVGQGPGSRFFLVALPSDDAERNAAIRDALVETSMFNRVLDSDSAAVIDSVPEPVWSYRYVLDDADMSGDALRTALQDRLADLSLGVGTEFDTLIASDPHLISIDVAEALMPVDDLGDWQLSDGSPLLVLESNASAFDIGAQRNVVDTVRSILDKGLGADVGRSYVSGVGVFSVDMSRTIESEARWRSIVASVIVILVLWLAYRRVRPVIVGVLPVATGGLIGLVLVALVFDSVHGITLAFGFTLLGVAIDYPLHLFSHSRGETGTSAIKRIWPTLRLGLVSTVIAYAAIAVSGTTGLAQLGVFTATGLVVAAAVTRWLLPHLMGELPVPAKMSNSAPAAGVGLRWWPVGLLAIAGVAIMLVTFNGQLWTNNLAALSPVPAADLKRDATMRRALGVANMSYVIALESPQLEDVLQATENISDALPELVDQQLIASAQSVTQLLPSQQTQQRRRDRLPDRTQLESRVKAAVADTTFKTDAFTPFIEAVTQERKNISIEDYQGTPFASFVDEHLYKRNGTWVSLITLYGDVNLDASSIQRWIDRQATPATLVDFRQASESLVTDYRIRTLRLLSIAFVVVCLLLLWRLRPRRAVWALTNVVCALITTAAIVYSIAGVLNLYHLMALLLVAGLGLDYALFLSRSDAPASDVVASRHAVLACAATTVAAFSVLGLSAIPALQSMGLTVAIGSGLSFAVARVGSMGGKSSTSSGSSH